MSKHPLTNKPLLTTRDLSEYWGVRMQTLQKWRITGEGPLYFKIGKVSKIRNYTL